MQQTDPEVLALRCGPRSVGVVARTEDSRQLAVACRTSSSAAGDLVSRNDGRLSVLSTLRLAR